MTLTPDDLDPSRAFAAGVSPEALREAVYVAAAFNLIDRFADAIGAQPASQAGRTREQSFEYGGRFLARGYA
jgi:hypothetical protein